MYGIIVNNFQIKAQEILHVNANVLIINPIILTTN
jgi:hypothetical protein